MDTPHMNIGIAPQAGHPTQVTRTELDAAAARLKNWGRWGLDDQAGTPNHTPAIAAILGSPPRPSPACPCRPARPLIASGALVALAVTGASRWPDLPDMPTMIDLGCPGFVTDTFRDFLAPAKMPPEIVSTLSRTAVDILRTKAVSDQLQANGFEVLAEGQEGMRRRTEERVPTWRDLIAKAGIAPV